MQILHRSRNKISVIYCDGILDWEGLSQLEFFLERSLEYLRGRILLNLGGITDMDHNCLGYLISQVAKIRKQGSDLSLSVLNASEYDVLSDLAVSDLILEYPSVMGTIADIPLLETNWSG
jgi:anti-anti-sigma regulatory factor